MLNTQYNDMTVQLQILQEKFPFLSIVSYGGVEYVAMVQHHGKNITSLYIINDMTDAAIRHEFLVLAAQWWHESNRIMPINLFFKQDFVKFSVFVRNFITRELTWTSGWSGITVQEHARRTKRRRMDVIMPMLINNTTNHNKA